ncbi:hypothetical protein KJY77_00445 [Canibacter sp. lx-72]|uniref:hypothetical protein n=1 Tax=Canibacter zhuwentaonis TaxID=2837491 RepID=UPI001BDCE37F|nr:hypothetical protein [Canibacter zhuwentaonis]MBT1017616.1 hypothetical protein [Canibacter zhuwentaonis]
MNTAQRAQFLEEIVSVFYEYEKFIAPKESFDQGGMDGRDTAGRRGVGEVLDKAKDWSFEAQRLMRSER